MVFFIIIILLQKINKQQIIKKEINNTELQTILYQIQNIQNCNDENNLIIYLSHIILIPTIYEHILYYCDEIKNYKLLHYMTYNYNNTITDRKGSNSQLRISEFMSHHVANKV